MEFISFYQDYSKKKKLPLPSDINERVEASLSVQIHTTGARPKFYDAKWGYVEPAAYDKRFDKLFATRLLNRHPNENDATYNLRLSLYAPVTKELYDRFLTMCRGTILQPNSYDLSVDDKTADYIGNNYVYSTLFEAINFVLENPYGYMAVIQSEKEVTTTDPLRPRIIFIRADELLMKDADSIAFTHKGRVYFLNDKEQYTIEGKTTYEFIHNFDRLPVWEIDNNFIEPYVAWADLLVRNMNDDEVMNKNYSYPIVQMVMPACTAPGCNGTGTIPDPADAFAPRLKCGTCHGTGTMSFNPGDRYVMSEDKIRRGGENGMYDMAKFITPDIGIPKYHLDRWQVFYDRTEKSLCLNKKINATESGDAKREDRKDQYFYLMTISNFVFKHLEKGINYISAYLNYNQATERFDNQEVVLIPPNQFDLMTDDDLINQFADLQTKTDDSQLLAEMQYQVNRRVYRNDKVQLMINDVLYYSDPLYGVAGNALKGKLLSGTFDENDKIIHEKGYNILKGISREMTPKVFVESDIKTLTNALMDKLPAPKGIYTP